MVKGSRQQIWFDSADDAYLVEAAIRRYLDATCVPDVLLVASVHGPALEMSTAAASDDLVQALVTRFGGHVDGSMPGDTAWTDDSPPTPATLQGV